MKYPLHAYSFHCSRSGDRCGCTACVEWRKARREAAATNQNNNTTT